MNISSPPPDDFAPQQRSISRNESPPWLKPVTEYGPLIAFFAAYVMGDLMVATAVLMIATLCALALSLAVARKVPLMPLITALIVGLFGGLTLWLHDDTFIKMKPTIVQAIIAAVLLGGLAFGRSLLKPVLGTAWRMDESGWRKLTLRFGLFFLAMAVINELVWRTQSTDVWVNFKVFGIFALTLVFALSQTPLLNRHKLPDDSDDAKSS